MMMAAPTAGLSWKAEPVGSAFDTAASQLFCRFTFL